MPKEASSDDLILGEPGDLALFVREFIIERGPGGMTVFWFNVH